jgi:transposase-like protein
MTQRKFTEARWLELAAEYERISGTAARAAFAAEHGVCGTTLCKWLRRVRARRAAEQGQAGSRPARDEAIEVRFGDALSVRLPADTKRSTLVAVLAELGALTAS